MPRGEVVGIIGRNGAGKSTLLKILSRITEPTEGEVDISGRVGSLLEVGTGFHPELTGRENVYLNGAILGMGRAEIARKFDEIVAFAEVEKFIDTPVKHYSSGMYMRLAFAVAAHLEPEILIVDEVLAVGDAEFQKKCLGKMGDVAKGGRTVLFVSHNMHAIKSLCTQGILLQAGRVFLDGSAPACVSHYLDQSSAGTNSPLVASPDTRAGSGEWRFTEVAATKPIFDSDEPKEFTFHVSPAGPDVGPVFFSGLLVNEEGTILTQLDSRLIGFWVRGPKPVRGRLTYSRPLAQARQIRIRYTYGFSCLGPSICSSGRPGLRFRLCFRTPNRRILQRLRLHWFWPTSPGASPLERDAVWDSPTTTH